MVKASDNAYPSLLVVETAAPVSPASGNQRLFIDPADHLLKTKNSAGTVTALGSSGALASGYATVATDQSSTGGAFADLATVGPTVTITVNTKVKVTISADTYGSASDTAMNMGVDISGANTVAAAEAQKMQTAYVSAVGSAGQASRVMYYSGLTPGSTTFKAKYYRGGSGTAHWRYREMLVECLD